MPYILPATHAITDYYFWYRSFSQPQLAERFDDSGSAVMDELYCVDSDDAGAIINCIVPVLYGPALPPLAGPEEDYIFIVDED